MQRDDATFPDVTGAAEVLLDSMKFDAKTVLQVDLEDFIAEVLDDNAAASRWVPFDEIIVIWRKPA